MKKVVGFCNISKSLNCKVIKATSHHCIHTCLNYQTNSSYYGTYKNGQRDEVLYSLISLHFTALSNRKRRNEPIPQWVQTRQYRGRSGWALLQCNVVDCRLVCSIAQVKTSLANFCRYLSGTMAQLAGRKQSWRNTNEWSNGIRSISI